MKLPILPALTKQSDTNFKRGVIILVFRVWNHLKTILQLVLHTINSLLWRMCQQCPHDYLSIRSI